MSNTYHPIGGGYAFASLLVGMTVRNPAGKEIYIQPGDDETAMRDNIEALDEIEGEDKRAIVADMLLGDYFQD